VEQIRIVRKVLGKPVGRLSPVSNPTSELKNMASFIRRINVSDLAGFQFLTPLCDRWIDGSALNKPTTWV